jgi:hypothetical protein
MAVVVAESRFPAPTARFISPILLLDRVSLDVTLRGRKTGSH